MAKRLTREQQLEKARAIEEKVRRDDFRRLARQQIERIRSAFSEGELVAMAASAHDLAVMTRVFLAAEDADFEAAMAAAEVPADEAAP